ncbi:MAG: hypothetical protein GY791_18590 [Alphaproteobacteria bacterium]|nr:hypothetical protein [Alphaproteobacteria bacterium]
MWGGGFGWVFGPLMMILFLAVIIGVVILILRWLGIAGQGAGGHDAAMTTLRERFARGEIDKEEFEERSRLLAG